MISQLFLVSVFHDHREAFHREIYTGTLVGHSPSHGMGAFLHLELAKNVEICKIYTRFQNDSL